MVQRSLYRARQRALFIVLVFFCGLLALKMSNRSSIRMPMPNLPQFEVELNSADPMELELLPGVGPSTARQIVNRRTEQGGFASVSELEMVPGIGEKTIEQLQNSATVRR